MIKIKGKKYRRVACKSNGKAPKGGRKIRRGKSRRDVCVIQVGKK